MPVAVNAVGRIPVEQIAGSLEELARAASTVELLGGRPCVCGLVGGGGEERCMLLRGQAQAHGGMTLSSGARPFRLSLWLLWPLAPVAVAGA